MTTARPDSTTRQLTVRLPRSLYRRAQQMAKARGTSLNALVMGLVAELEKRDREMELVDAYALLGRDAESDVGFARRAQGEVADE